MTEKGMNLIKKWEGCKLEAYLCPAGVATIGYGMTYYPTGKKVQLGDKITQQQADEMFKWLVENKYETPVKMQLGETYAILNNLSVDALVSFAYNVGVKAFAQSTLLKKIKADKLDFCGIQKEFNKWVKSAGKVLPGLQKRRVDEFNLYLEGIAAQYTKLEIFHFFLD